MMTMYPSAADMEHSAHDVMRPSRLYVCIFKNAARVPSMSLKPLPRACRTMYIVREHRGRQCVALLPPPRPETLLNDGWESGHAQTSTQPRSGESSRRFELGFGAGRNRTDGQSQQRVHSRAAASSVAEKRKQEAVQAGLACSSLARSAIAG